ncbi:H-NS family nucleoid-associated regulatory protein [Burkholderia ubonensis]|uniref:H-NS family nucleoid-associated regulatory protein n=1 Tax=Burkholderia ubonensis TaxID=101571 RepID=UPI0018DF29B9
MHRAAGFVIQSRRRIRLYFDAFRTSDWCWLRCDTAFIVGRLLRAKISGIQLKTRRVRRRAPALAKYRDPASGAVWSGRERTPRWIAGQDREMFLIHTLA